MIHSDLGAQLQSQLHRRLKSEITSLPGPHCNFLFLFLFLRQGFPVALEHVLELALVDQAGLELTEITLPLSPECWD